jgi:maltose alpha-D-glucosyltransferase/alpha-amylase
MADSPARRGARPEAPAGARKTGMPDDPLWYKDAIIYELHVRAFADSNADGTGDFRGLTARLDYLRDLGITAIWLLPFYPSPWKDDGYDIADYTGIHPVYGSTQDFKRFMREAHRRGLRVINELVINHTSDQHPWFQRARTAPPGSAHRDFYVWSDTPDRYPDARIIFKDFESSNWAWDPVARAYYWHRFYAHQPDLNFENPAVHAAIFRVMDHWFRLGVDGMRLDAIPYLFEREGTNCENLPETHGFLKQLRAHLDAAFPGRMFLAEANQWPEETVPYFGAGDECHMSFHFPVMPRLFMGIQMEDRFPIVDILAQTPPIPDSCQWATFLRNHDELTLEMVTDEERDYMYRMYASDPQARINLGIRRRLAPLLQNNRRKIELMNALLFSLPGTPVLYYGDEIGMGDNIYLGDRNGVRTPMQWSGDRNAGFSRANPQRLYLPVIVDPEYHYEAINVETQQANASSLLWWTRRLIALRKRFRAFGRGSIEFVDSENRKILAFVRCYEDEHVLVVANLSRFVQFARLDLARYAGTPPVELFGRTEFPPIGTQPYFLTLGPHAFYWFQLQPVAAAARPERAGPIRLQLGAAPDSRDGLDDLLHGDGRAQLQRVLPRHLAERRWFQGKARAIRDVRLADTVRLSTTAGEVAIAFVQVDYIEEGGETYVLPLALARADGARRITHGAVVADIGGADGPAVLYDALQQPAFRAALLRLGATRRRVRGDGGELHGQSDGSLRRLAAALDSEDSRVIGAEQTNSSVVFGSSIILKLYRRLEDGESLDVEIGRFLTERGFANTPAVLGWIDYVSDDRPPRTLATIQRFVLNEGDAWQLTLDELGAFFERAAAAGGPPPDARTDTRSLLQHAVAPEAGTLIGAFAEEARILGRRTAELHLALASDPDVPAFAPEPFTMFYQRSLYQSMRNLAGRVLRLLAARAPLLPDHVRERAAELIGGEARLLARFRRIIDHGVGGMRIRCHGDYHLGQVLFTGNDFVITDFEGEPIRPLSERRLKRSPLRDVAGMLRSFHYAVHAAVRAHADGGRAAATHAFGGFRLEPWARFWYATVATIFLDAYHAGAARARFLPSDPSETAVLLDAYLLEKAVYELGYELNNRPDWAAIPLEGLLELLRE